MKDCKKKGVCKKYILILLRKKEKLSYALLNKVPNIFLINYFQLKNFKTWFDLKKLIFEDRYRFTLFFKNN